MLDLGLDHPGRPLWDPALDPSMDLTGAGSGWGDFSNRARCAFPPLPLFPLFPHFLTSTDKMKTSLTKLLSLRPPPFIRLHLTR